MKCLRTKLLLFFLVVALPTLAVTDTNTVNKWNDEALNLAYSDPAKAMKLAQQSLETSRKIHFSRGEVRALIRMGIIYDVTAKNDDAIRMYKKSLQLSYNTNDQRGVASNLNNLGLIYYKINQYHTSLKYFNRAYVIFNRLQDEVNLGSVSNNIGMLYDELNQYKNAVAWFKGALKHYEKSGETPAIYDVYSNLGNTMEKSSRYKDAIHYSNRAIEGYRKTGNKYGLGMSLNNLGLGYRMLHQHEKAIPCYEESIENSKAIGNTFSQVSATYNLANSLRAVGNYERSYALLKDVFPIVKELDSKELCYKVCFDLAIATYRFGDRKEGERLMWEYKKYHHAYYMEAMNQSLLEAEDKFQLEQIQQQSSFKVKRLEDRRYRDNLMWSGGVVVVVLIAFLIFFIYRKSNLQKELEGQKAIFEATMEERRRISYDLHDHVGSQLSYVVNNLELLMHTSGSSERINNTFTMSQAAMSSLRDTVWTLHTEEITTELFVQRMENVMRKNFEHHPEMEANVTLNTSPEIVLPPQVTMHVMRIFQEAIHNIVKHAQATTVEVTLQQQGDWMQLRVTDNGVGMKEDSVKPFHYGLQSMRERATKIGGKIEVKPVPDGHGTVVFLQWKNTPIA